MVYVCEVLEAGGGISQAVGLLSSFYSSCCGTYSNVAGSSALVLPEGARTGLLDLCFVVIGPGSH